MDFPQSVESPCETGTSPPGSVALEIPFGIPLRFACETGTSPLVHTEVLQSDWVPFTDVTYPVITYLNTSVSCN